METKWWHLVGILLIGVIIGFFIDFPNKFEIVFEVKNDTREWWDTAIYDIENVTNLWANMTNMCCYPSDCEQAERNPDLCTCVYMVQCFTEEEAMNLSDGGFQGRLDLPTWANN